MDIMYIDNHQVKINLNMLVVSMWNKQVDEKNQIYLNDKEFFENSFEDKMGAAWAASAGAYWHTDKFVYFSEEGFLTSFTRLDDETCPIKIDKIISSVLQVLQELQKLNKKGYVTNIPRAIHDALQEV